MRRRSIREPRNASEDLPRSHSDDSRIVDVERVVGDMAKSVDALSKRMMSLEAQIDYLASKIRPS